MFTKSFAPLSQPVPQKPPLHVPLYMTPLRHCVYIYIYIYVHVYALFKQPLHQCMKQKSLLERPIDKLKTNLFFVNMFINSHRGGT